MNRSEISNDFNFENELDISNRGKDKTQIYFSKEGFQFEDFMNVGDRTFKSDKPESKLIQNNSKISRDNSRISKDNSKDKEEEMPSKILEEFSSLYQKPRDQSVLNTSNISQQKPLSVHPPKFGDTVKSIPLINKQEFTLRPASPKKQLNSPNFGKVVTIRTPEDEYLSLEGQIKYYVSEGQRLQYEGSKLEIESEQLMAGFNLRAYEQEMEKHAMEIKQINKQIEQQKQLERQLTCIEAQLEEEYENLITSIKSSRFPRPTKVGDDAKAIIDDINTLRAQLESIERDEGSLNLSSTLMNIPSSSLVKIQSENLSPRKQFEDMIRNRLEEIRKIDKEGDDPRFIYNLKMACLRPDWTLFMNSELQVSVCYREHPKVSVKIGNKTTSDLTRFTLRQEGQLKLQGQVIAGRSYVNHQIQLAPSHLLFLFGKVELSYCVMGQQKKVVLFVPLGLTNYGCFEPVTQKQFDNEVENSTFQATGSFRPIDRKIIASIEELTVHMPDILVTEDKACGFFRGPFKDPDMVIFRQRGDLLSVSTKDNNQPLLKLLEFIFTL